MIRAFVDFIALAVFFGVLMAWLHVLAPETQPVAKEPIIWTK